MKVKKILIVCAKMNKIYLQKLNLTYDDSNITKMQLKYIHI